MSKLLIDESPLVFQPSLAKALNIGRKRNGVQKAIIMQEIHYLSRQSPHVHEGEKWVTFTFDEWEEYLPFWKADSIRKLFAEMVEEGLLIECNNPLDKFDRSKWHRVNRLHPALNAASSRQRMPVDNKNKEEKEVEKETRKSLYAEWEKLQPITPIVAEDLETFVWEWDAHELALDENHPDKGRAGKEVVIEAIRETARSADRPNINYTGAIMKGWMKNGYKVDTRKKRTNGTKETTVQIAKGGGVYGA